MTKVALIKNVSISELLHMREQGMTNDQIAKKLGVSNRTILNYLGRQPKGLRKKREYKVKSLPPVGEKVTIEIPHKSFADRLEESYKKPVPVGTIEIPEKVQDDVSKKIDAPVREVANPSILPKPYGIPDGSKPLTLADIARKAHQNAIAETTKPAEDSTHIPELIAMFGHDAVTAWLKVSLYNMGIPDCRPMSRKKMLEMLKIMNSGGESV